MTTTELENKIQELANEVAELKQSQYQCSCNKNPAKVTLTPQKLGHLKVEEISSDKTGDGKIECKSLTVSDKITVDSINGLCNNRLSINKTKNNDPTITAQDKWLRVTNNCPITFWTNGKGNKDDVPQFRFNDDCSFQIGNTTITENELKKLKILLN